MKLNLINIHSVIPCSKVNGPGERVVVFFKGCNRSCKGCFNPETHAESPKTLTLPRVVLGELSDHSVVTGITISGGEPFLQPSGLAELLRLAKVDYNLTSVVYSGFTLEEIKADTEKAVALEFIDVLIDAPFEEDKKEKKLLARGSTNQSFHFLTDIYSIKDFEIPGKTEITIDKNGQVIATGFDSAGLKDI
ncbi:MAG: radical SAM protein [Deltaproteobacteria bacterium]|nr:radical SAM protein [Deltaproteobacteria bacterium]